MPARRGLSDRVQAEAVHDGVAKHVHRVSQKRGGVGQQAGTELGQKHPGVDREHDVQDATLLLGNVRPDIAAVFIAVIIDPACSYRRPTPPQTASRASPAPHR